MFEAEILIGAVVVGALGIVPKVPGVIQANGTASKRMLAVPTQSNFHAVKCARLHQRTFLRDRVGPQPGVIDSRGIDEVPKIDILPGAPPQSPCSVGQNAGSSERN